jgi:molecular chaperone IbpA
MVSSLMRQMQLEPFFLGFDDAFNQLMGLKNDLNKHISNYPPYNIKKIDDNEFELEFAVAGFDKKDVKVVMDMGKLRVSGTIGEREDGTEFLHKGIATRSFSSTFALGEHVEVESAEVENGLLKVRLKKYLPKHLQPKEIVVR